jgi:hypothetical protein
MQTHLSAIAIVLGLVMAGLNFYGVIKPNEFGVAVRKFPRSTGIGYILVLFGTAWFVWNLREESIADFESLKPALYALFIAVGVGTCLFVKDFIAIRGLAIVLLLLARLMVDAGRPRLGETPWILVNQALAYVFVIAGIWFTVSPWRLRDLLHWATANEKRTRIGSGVRMAVGVFIAILGVTVY